MLDIKIGDKVKVIEVNANNWNYLDKNWDRYLGKIGTVKKLDNEGKSNIFIEFQSPTLDSSWWSRGELIVK